MGKNTVLVICAHSDDQIFGAGATLAKYAKEGKSIYTYIFSYGENSHPWLKSHITTEIRIKESKEADAYIGGKGVEFFGLKENNFPEDAKNKNILKKIADIVKEKKPAKIFTHSVDDPHPDHRAVHNIVLESLKSTRHKCDIYSFDIWNLLQVKHRNVPKLVVDANQTFKMKIEALQTFKSQWASLISLMPSVYTRAIMHGMRYGYRFAEVFRKIK